jgi:NADP-dependent 3-hydroxy acid dehydrogenase YdfG
MTAVSDTVTTGTTNPGPTTGTTATGAKTAAVPADRPRRQWDDPATWSTVVSGGSSGLGRALCRRLTDLGAAVVSLDRAVSDDVETIEVDLGDTVAAGDAVRLAAGRLGAIDAVVCCAGIDVPGPLDTVDPVAWDHIVTVNLLGTAAVVRAALPTLRARRGRVVTVASTLGHRAVADATAYCASKFGVVGFSRALAAECRGEVGVTLLTPGGMRTAFFDGRDDQYRPPADAVLADPATIAESIIWALSRPEGIEIKELAVMAPAEGSWP